MSDRKKAAWTLTIVIALLLFGTLWSAAGNPFCTATVFTEARDHGQASWCFEFWLSRYQTLLGATAAITAAATVWTVGIRQIRSGDAVLEIARRQAAAAALVHIIARRSLLDDVVRAVKSSEEAISGIRLEKLRNLLENTIPAKGWWLDQLAWQRRVFDIVNALDQDIRTVQATLSEIIELSQKPAATSHIRLPLNDEAIRIGLSLDAAKQLSKSLQSIHALIGSNPVVIPPGVEVLPRESIAEINARHVDEIAASRQEVKDKCDALEAITLARAGIDTIRTLETERGPIMLLLDQTVAQIEGREF